MLDLLVLKVSKILLKLIIILTIYCVRKKLDINTFKITLAFKPSTTQG